MNIILFFITMELGYTPNYAQQFEDTIIQCDDLFDLSIQPEFEIFNLFSIGGDLSIKMIPGHVFAPVQIDSLFFINFNYFDGFSIGYEHDCAHPIIPWGKNDEQLRNFNAYYNRFYIRYTNKE